ncbi:cytochrome P450 [Mangrovimicrobium sediminis]|uniref:Cytochrome P450 n=1 Tax=Mangrovimicrobium sediminis TaxID=2562682 RepID=A0A4Z0LX79_9GAMM|nr:cytochrome P450 [Haliea sp. SAOS-164]TGD71834.1 cytochrome P450 [Haliea sp. SAOS-164]
MTIAIGDLQLPELPIDRAEFALDPQRFLEPAREQHPWLARFSKGFVVHGHQAARDLLFQDDKMGPHFAGLVEHFGAENTGWARFMIEQMATISGPRHDRLRASVATAFTPRRANQTRPLMRQVITALLDEWAPRGRFDFAEFASYFPITVMCGLLGVSAEPVRGIRAALDAQMSCMTLDRDLLPTILEAFELLWNFADSVIVEREASGEVDEDSLLDALIASKNNGGLNENELRDLLISMLLAGYDTSKNELTMTMYHLLQHPQMLERCAQDAAYCRKVIDEGFRHSSVVSPSRTLDTALDYDGIHMPAGTYLCFALPMTGRDPAAFPDPLRFDPDRSGGARPIPFGRGTHICLGQYLARAQLEEGIHLIAQRLVAPQLDGEVTWRPFLAVWGIQELPIAFTPA